MPGSFAEDIWELEVEDEIVKMNGILLTGKDKFQWEQTMQIVLTNRPYRITVQRSWARIQEEIIDNESDEETWRAWLKSMTAHFKHRNQTTEPTKQ